MIQEVKGKIKESDGEKAIQYEVFDFGSKDMHIDEEKAEEYEQMADQLGLKGVKEFIDRFDEMIAPFPKMTEVEERVWGAYCSTDVAVEEYENFIPMEVLEVLKKCKENNYFEEHGYQVWTETEEDVDPLLVGVSNDEEDYHWRESYHLIARWGYALKDFDEIAETVRERLITEQKRKLKSRLAGVEENVESYFNGQGSSDRFI